MKFPVVSALAFIAVSAALHAKPDPNWLDHDRDRPQPAVVEPGTFSSPGEPGRPPSDATVLFDGRDVSQWVAMDGSPTKWIVRDGVMECVPHSGYARTLQSFGDCQVHVEWATPYPIESGWDRGNSGVFFGYDRYEIQIFDSWENRNYADGVASAVYGQYPPLVNVSRRPGQWQTYDIVWTAPRFKADGSLVSRARVTILHNGVLVQDNVELTGPTSWLQRAPYKAHPERLPISLQDHGSPVRFRNIWVRELGSPRQKEFMLPDAVLDGYVGVYPDRNRGPQQKIYVRRAPDGLLLVTIGGIELLMHAQSPTKFFSATTDLQCEFSVKDGKREVTVFD